MIFFINLILSNIICLIASIFDSTTYRIPNLLIGIGTFCIISVFFIIPNEIYQLPMQISTALVTYLLLMIFSIVQKGKFGMGDVKLSALLALSIPLVYWIATMLIACIAGIIYFLLLRLTIKVNLHHKIPFAPCLLIGTITSYYLYYNSIINIDLLYFQILQ